MKELSSKENDCYAFGLAVFGFFILFALANVSSRFSVCWSIVLRQFRVSWFRSDLDLRRNFEIVCASQLWIS